MDIDKLRQIINSKYNAEVIKDGLINSLAFDDDFIDSVLRLRSSKNPKDFVWTENNVIDFVNWHMEVKFPKNSFRYHLENQTLIDSFKRGDKASDWVDKRVCQKCGKLFKPNILKPMTICYECYDNLLT